jgi:hypothetical protein
MQTGKSWQSTSVHLANCTQVWTLFPWGTPL